MKQLMRILTVLFIPLFMATLYNPVDASWLSKTLDKLDRALGIPAGTTTTSDGTMKASQRGERWIEVSSNKYYTTYVDRRSLEASGQAQNRKVKANFMHVFTPLGSQWIGNTSGGDVKPDVITVAISKSPLEYAVNWHTSSTAQYYDVHGNLIYDGILKDFYRSSYFGEKYVPMSEQEQIKDTLFAMFGWNY
ncbi:hypothetical protein [Veillonella sp. R32]|uniref:hypothetical protein n=1 Tax=Veillonella sp. R32 TaxID=2021312 RepID=UPI001389E2A0|nr:hypothetical protein [Veillonella sp. R32]KAF1679146.1 hypothetical protein VER_09380 [Veillonella sp. R32]